VLWRAEKTNEERSGVSESGYGNARGSSGYGNLYDTIKEEVNTWETEIKRISAAMTKVTNKDREESLEIQMSNAQVMLKQALIQLNQAHEQWKGGHTEDIVMVENEEGELVRSDTRDDKGGITDRVVNKDMEDSQGTVDSSNGIDGKVVFLGIENISNKTETNVGTEKKSKGYEINWADMSDDETVALQNLKNKNKPTTQWQIAGERRKQIKQKTTLTSATITKKMKMSLKNLLQFPIPM
jgi:hypothetical protein